MAIVGTMFSSSLLLLLALALHVPVPLALLFSAPFGVAYLSRKLQVVGVDEQVAPRGWRRISSARRVIITNIVQAHFAFIEEDIGAGYIIETSDSEFIYVGGEALDEITNEGETFPSAVVFDLQSSCGDILRAQKVAGAVDVKVNLLSGIDDASLSFDPNTAMFAIIDEFTGRELLNNSDLARSKTASSPSEALARMSRSNVEA